MPTLSPLKPFEFQEKGGPSLILSEACDNEFMSRMDGALSAAFGKSIAKKKSQKNDNVA